MHGRMHAAKQGYFVYGTLLGWIGGSAEVPAGVRRPGVRAA
jgi:hypothetical protein